MGIVKTVATGVAALAIVGGVAGGLASVATPSSLAAGVRLTTVDAPLPQDPSAQPQAAASVPTPDQLTGVLTTLANPKVSFSNKSNLVQGGISGMAAHVADKKLQKAAKNGQLPLSFGVTNISPAADGSATADVAVSGPKLSSPVTQNVTFVNQGGWVLSRASAMELLEAVGQ